MREIVGGRFRRLHRKAVEEVGFAVFVRRFQPREFFAGSGANGDRLQDQHIGLPAIERRKVIADAEPFAIGLARETEASGFALFAGGSVGIGIPDDQVIAIAVGGQVGVNRLRL